MARSLLHPFLFFWLWIASVLSRTLAEHKTNAKHLGLSFDGRNGSQIHGYEKHKRNVGGHLLRRCNTSQNPNSGETPASSRGSPNTNTTASAGESKKWGLAWPNGEADYLAHFTRPKVHYLYTWSPYLPSRTADFGLEGIPMLWGWNQVDDFNSMVVRGYATKVLGMNEPNEPSQSNMSPSDGISMWKQYIDPLKDQGYYLISPACTNDQAGLDWMKIFIEGCTGCTIDAIAFHFYGTDWREFARYATSLHDTYQKPIWVTEFADQNFSGSGSQASISEIYAFQSAVIDFVDSTPWIEAAFPFGVMHDLQGVNEGNSLLTSDGWPTSLAYNYFG